MTIHEMRKQNLIKAKKLGLINWFDFFSQWREIEDQEIPKLTLIKGKK